MAIDPNGRRDGGRPGDDVATPVHCPAEAVWERIRATAGESADAHFLAHVDRCPACSQRLAALAAEWSQETILAHAAAEATDASPLVAGLFLRDRATDHARPPPAIDGLEGLVEVGRGGMGIVYRARDVRRGEIVAVKVLTASAATSPEGRARAEREARSLARVEHPNIVRVLAVTEADGLPAIEMEWIDGVSLADRRRAGPMAPREAAGIVRDLARAVEAMHAAGIIHRDIKPANVLLAPSPDGRPVPKIVDFGLARSDSAAPADLTRTTAAVGTPSFMAPEQTGLVPELGRVGPATDIHALGGVLCWLLSGRAPYDDHSSLASLHRAAHGEAVALGRLVPDLPPALGTIAATCLARRPERRYPSAGALADDLERFLAGMPISARRPSPASRLVDLAGRHPALAAATVTAALALVAGGVAIVRAERARSALALERTTTRAAEELARGSFAALTDDDAARLIARGGALDDADRARLVGLRDRYRSWPLGVEPAATFRFRIAGLRRLTTIFLRLARPDDAIDTLHMAIESYDDLEARGVAQASDLAALLDIEAFDQSLLLAVGRADEAAAEATAAIGRLEHLIATRPEFERHLPGAWGALAIAESRRGRLDEAAALAHRAVDACDRLLAATPDDVGLLVALLPVYLNVAAQPDLGSDDDARVGLYARATDLAEEGLGTFDEAHESLGASALIGLCGMADIDLARGRPAAALEAVERRSVLARRLATEIPDSELISSEPMATARQAYLCHAALGRPGDARKDLEEAIGLATRAVAAEPALVSRARVLGWVLEALAEVEVAEHHPEAAISLYGRIVEVLGPWTAGGKAPPDISELDARAREAIDRLEHGVAAAPAEVPADADPR